MKDEKIRESARLWLLCIKNGILWIFMVQKAPKNNLEWSTDSFEEMWMAPGATYQDGPIDVKEQLLKKLEDRILRKFDTNQMFYLSNPDSCVGSGEEEKHYDIKEYGIFLDTREDLDLGESFYQAGDWDTPQDFLNSNRNIAPAARDLLEEFQRLQQSGKLTKELVSDCFKFEIPERWEEVDTPHQASGGIGTWLWICFKTFFMSKPQRKRVANSIRS